jgi:hypothetical protein
MSPKLPFALAFACITYAGAAMAADPDQDATDAVAARADVAAAPVLQRSGRPSGARQAPSGTRPAQGAARPAQGAARPAQGAALVAY